MSEKAIAIGIFFGVWCLSVDIFCLLETGLGFIGWAVKGIFYVVPKYIIDSIKDYLKCLGRGHTQISFKQFKKYYLVAPEKYEFYENMVYYYPDGNRKGNWVSLGFNSLPSLWAYNRFRKYADKELERNKNKGSLKRYLEYVQQDIREELQEADSYVEEAKETVVKVKERLD